MKEKATIAFNINDVFNSRKRKMETYIPNVIQSYSEMQYHQRQFTLSFTYRINKQKTDKEKEKQPKREMENGGEDFQG
jgi:outer membrane receptor for ferrienterochelin and colicins